MGKLFACGSPWAKGFVLLITARSVDILIWILAIFSRGVHDLLLDVLDHLGTGVCLLGVADVEGAVQGDGDRPRLGVLDQLAHDLRIMTM